jgi:Uma2 family endonuclease
MTTIAKKLMTADEFFEWCHRPDHRDRNFELEHGEIVEMPQPGERHGVVCANVTRVLGNYAFQIRKGYVCSNDTGIIWEHDPDSVRGPDVVLYDTARRYEELHLKYSDEIPQLVVEVLSPNDRWSKVMRRVTQYLKRGVSVVWVVDPEDRTVSVHRRDQLPQVCEENDEVTGAPVLPDLRCRVADFFFMPG